MALRVALLTVTLLAAGLLACGGHGATRTTTRRTVHRARQRASRRGTAPARRRLIAASPALVTHGPARHRWVALTFDADMTEGMLAELRSGRQRTWLDHALFAELRSTRTPATIFLTGLWARTYARFVGRLARDPLFELENHSFDHAAWESPCYGLPTVTSTAAKRREVLQTQRIVERVARVRPRLFRFPGVCHTPRDQRIVARLGLRPVDGDVVSGDAFNPSAASIVRAVLARVRPGSIVIAHCIGAPNTPATARAIAELIPALRARRYRFVTVERLLTG